MVISNGLLIAEVTHARKQPAQHAFRYGVYYLSFALDEMARIGNKLLSLNRFNLFSFHERDHGARDGSPNQAWIRNVLTEWNVPQADGRIVLVTLPRLLGYVFNPVSFWFCLDREHKVRAVLSEVCNTFGERHCYLSAHPDRRPIGNDDWLRAEKVFHVSPFMDVNGYYLFRFVYLEDKIGVWIDHYNENGLMLTTSITGRRTALTESALLRCFLRYPMVTLKIIGLIHFEAVRLLMKGVRYRPKPLPPTTEVSQ